METLYVGKQPPENIKKATCTIYKNDGKKPKQPIADCFDYSEDFILPAINSHEPLLASLKGAYEYFSKFGFDWEGRDTALGQFVLSNMKESIEKAESNQSK